MTKRLAIIGIDSLEPTVLLKMGDKLPNFSSLIKQSPVRTAQSVFPVDTVPAWASIYTGLHPGNHGVLYVYDVFDPKLGDLKKVDIGRVRGKTFWDIAGRVGKKVAVMNPMLAYPAWEVNGVMISKSPFDHKIDDINTRIDMSVYPADKAEPLGVPNEVGGVWGGHPGIKRIPTWANKSMDILKNEEEMALRLLTTERWDLFFAYFSILDIIQHRCWRFFDKNDPLYRVAPFGDSVTEFYKELDRLLGKVLEAIPDTPLMVISDHGHQIRPYTTINIAEALRQRGLVSDVQPRTDLMASIRNVVASIVQKWEIEHLVLRVVTKSKVVTTLMKKSMSDSVSKTNNNDRKVKVSQFAGLKSYPHGGVEINRDFITKAEVPILISEVIIALNGIKGPDGLPAMQWVKRRDDLYPGKYTQELYPDVLFEMRPELGVGWGLGTKPYGRAYDHSVASGGHSPNATFLLPGFEVGKKIPTIIDYAPTILDLIDIDVDNYNMDGESVLVDR